MNMCDVKIAFGKILVTKLAKKAQQQEFRRKVLLELIFHLHAPPPPFCIIGSKEPSLLSLPVISYMYFYCIKLGRHEEFLNLI